MAQAKKHFFIHCLNEEVHGKGGKEVGEILINDQNGVTYLGDNGLLSARKRFDGNWGFECICGNDSRLAPSEKGLIGRNRPNPAALQKIAKNLADPKKQAILKKHSNYIEVDGFRMTSAADVVE